MDRCERIYKIECLYASIVSLRCSTSANSSESAKPRSSAT